MECFVALNLVGMGRYNGDCLLEGSELKEEGNVRPCTILGLSSILQPLWDFGRSLLIVFLASGTMGPS